MGRSKRNDSSEAAALARSVRSRSVLLVLLLVVAVAAALFELNRDHGRGLAEEPSRILVVARDGGDYELLENSGFELTVATPDVWAEHAAEVLGTESNDLLPSLLELADELGYGFVMLDDVADVDMSGISIEEGTFDPTKRFTVITAGDLADPLELTHEGESSPVVKNHAFGALQALLAQSRFDPNREILVHRPAVFELNLQHRIEPGFARLESARALEGVIANIHEEVAGALADERARLLVDEFESGGAIPLPDGGVLVLRQTLEVASRDARTLSWTQGTSLILERLAAPAFARATRRPCSLLAGGAIAVSEIPELVASDDGSTIVIDTLATGTTLYRARPEAGACGFERVGEVPIAEDERSIGTPRGTAVARRIFGADEDSSIAVRDVSGGDTRFPAVPGVALSEPVWIDDSLIAAVGRAIAPGDPPAPALYLFDRRRPDRVLRWDALHLVGDIAAAEPPRTGSSLGPSGPLLRAVVALPDGQGVVLLSGTGPTSLFRVERVRDPGEFAPSEGTEGAVVELPRDAFASTELRLDAVVFDPAVSPDGRQVAFAYLRDGMRNSGIAIAELSARSSGPEAEAAGLTELEFLTDDEAADTSPRFTRDGTAIVFQTRVPVSVGGRSITAPRVIDRPAPAPSAAEP